MVFPQPSLLLLFLCLSVSLWSGLAPDGNPDLEVEFSDLLGLFSEAMAGSLLPELFCSEAPLSLQAASVHLVFALKSHEVLFPV